ncbi:phosphatase PAP2 family protein [Agilicoccus flavus]|uniref:phosphatase PAP2 family protein n=1 Tax=Agilicoccus flavus TaxID=2775968 RepID=UPI001CF6B9BA|nr:phosphatase PAP2 family protein [Agilicoccus flavus]
MLDIVDGWDRALLDAIVAHRVPWLDGFTYSVGRAGISPTAAVVGLALAVAFVVLTRAWRPALAVVGAVVVAEVGVGVLKEVIARPRPDAALQLLEGSGYAFPSTHAAFTSAASAALVVVLAGRSRRLARWTAVVLALACVTVAAMMVYLGSHWASDALAGWLIGVPIGVVAGRLGRRGARPSDPVGAGGEPHAHGPGGDERAQVTGPEGEDPCGHAGHHVDPAADPVDFWDGLYGAGEQVWSGRVNPILATVAAGLPPGRALDVGAGEGADSVWLAGRGWDVTAVDISATALARADRAAAAAGVADRVHTRRVDLARELPRGPFDLVSAQFFQSPLDLPRDRVLRDLAGELAPGGRLLVVDHGTVPPWGQGHHDLPTVEQTVATVGLDPDAFDVERADTRARLVTGPDGQEAEILDNVVLARRHVAGSSGPQA